MFYVEIISIGMDFYNLQDYFEWCRQKGWDNYSVIKDEVRWFFFFKENIQVRTEHKKIEPTYKNWKESLK